MGLKSQVQDMTQGPDDMHAALKATIEVETNDHLWHPDDGVDFVPRLCDKIFGDGRALLRLTTINSRPRYYVLRIDSRWDVEDRDAPDGAYDLREALDEIYQALGEELGLASDEDEELDKLSAWPVLDHDLGTSWRRMSWPELAGATFEPHPFAPYCNLLVTNT